MFFLRFDMRAPPGGAATIQELYQAATAMVQWGESNGCLTAMISEHHASPDNYLPSPMLLASNFAAVTATLPINIGAILLNLYDPIKLAEDMTVLDILSQGRVSYVIGLGYRKEEYDMFGVAMATRGQVMEEKIAALMQALRGESFDYLGRQVHITTPPQSSAGITISYGGHSKAAARRAGDRASGMAKRAIANARLRGGMA